MDKKKILSAIIAGSMMMAAIGVCAVADTTTDIAEATEYVAMVGNDSYTILSEAFEKAEAGDTITLLQDVDFMPSINKPLVIQGSAEKYINVNCHIAENFPDINGTVTFQYINFNDRISTENRSTDQSKLNLKFINCNFNIPAGNTYAIQGGASWCNDYLGRLYVEKCTFTTEANSFISGYMIYAQCVGVVEVTGCELDGNGVYRGAIHLGDSIVYGTTATIENNKIKNFARGVQSGNRVTTSIKIDNNQFVDIAAITGETESAPIYIHEIASADATDIVVTNNNFGSSEYAIFSDNTTTVSQFISKYENNTPADTLRNDTYQPNAKETEYEAIKVVADGIETADINKDAVGYYAEGLELKDSYTWTVTLNNDTQLAKTVSYGNLSGEGTAVVGIILTDKFNEYGTANISKVTVK